MNFQKLVVSSLVAASAMLTSPAPVFAYSETFKQAIYNKDLATVKRMLASRRVNVNEKDPGENKDGARYLEDAAFSGSYEMVKLLLAYGANVNGRDDLGNTALMMAVGDEPHELQIMKLLIDRGANRNYVNHLGLTAYGLAQRNNLPKAMQLLQTYKVR